MRRLPAPPLGHRPPPSAIPHPSTPRRPFSLCRKRRLICRKSGTGGAATCCENQNKAPVLCHSAVSAYQRSTVHEKSVAGAPSFSTARTPPRRFQQRRVTHPFSSAPLAALLVALSASPLPPSFPSSATRGAHLAHRPPLSSLRSSFFPLIASVSSLRHSFKHRLHRRAVHLRRPAQLRPARKPLRREQPHRDISRRRPCRRVHLLGPTRSPRGEGAQLQLRLGGSHRPEPRRAGKARLRGALNDPLKPAAQSLLGSFYAAGPKKPARRSASAHMSITCSSVPPRAMCSLMRTPASDSVVSG